MRCNFDMTGGEVAMREEGRRKGLHVEIVDRAER